MNQYRVASASSRLPMVCPFAIGKAFGLAAATRKYIESSNEAKPQFRGRDMPEPTETPNVYEAMPEAAPQAIVVHCSAPRFQTAFDQFIEQELGLAKGEFIPLVIAGGAGVLAHPERLPKEFKFMRDRFELFRRTYPSIRRIVLINHEDCAYYRMLTEKLPGFLPPREDMGLIGDIFTRLLAHLGVQAELYYAHFADHDHTKVVFDRMTL